MNIFYKHHVLSRCKQVLFVLAWFLSATGQASAQITITDNQTAVQLVNRFVGSGVIVYNEVLNCEPTHNGVFTTVASNLGLPGGVILCTGQAAGTGGLAGPANVQVNQDIFGGLGDADLDAIIGSNNTHDACALTFNFVPNIDTATLLHFQYVFGSDEYPEYACSGFNDVFAFMMTGPNFAPNQNIALVPGTNIPVAINSINPGAGIFGNLANCQAMGPGSPFTQYYVSNTGGQTVALDGFTTVLDAEALLQPCDTYKIKLAIANVNDEAFQSAVFLKENSFIIDTVSFSASGFIPTGGGYLVEGCTPTGILFQRDVALPQRKKICIQVGGTSTNGTDFPFIADTVIILPNTLSTTVTVTPLLDATTEPVETVIIRRVNCCNNAPIDSVVLQIRDSLAMTLLTPDTFFCAQGAQQTMLHVTGDTAYSYNWSPATGVADSTDTLTFTSPPPTQTTVYTVTASYPGCPSVSRSTTVSIEPLPIVNVRPDTAICAYDNLLITATVDPPQGPYTYLWTSATTPNHLDDSTIQQPTFHNDTLGVYHYTLTVATLHNCLGSDTFKVRTLRVPTVNISEGYQGFCTHSTYHMEVTSFPLNLRNFNWTPGTYLSDSTIEEPVYYSDDVNLQHYVLEVTTSDNCKAKDSIDIQTYTVPVANIGITDTIVCLKDSMRVFVDVQPSDSASTYAYSWTPTNWLGNPNEMQPLFFSQEGAYNWLHLNITTPAGCTAEDDALIRTSPPVEITVTPNTTILYGNSIHLNADGAYHYFWTPSRFLDNSNIKDPIAHPTEPTEFTVYAMGKEGICRDTGIVSVNIDYSMTEFIPSGFTPNFDGKNDLFKVFNMKYQRLLEFRVFDRWGEKMFETINADDGWDGNYKGQACDAGVYNYVIRVSRPDGTQKLYTGDVTLIR